jgi:ABC-type polysaccharide/polyol phosphate transport system ATPase subunit
VIGETGSGKTALLLSILQELKIISGNMEIRGKIAYVE